SVGDLLGLEMEYLKGEDLQKALERGGPWPLQRVQALVREVAQGLYAAHKNKIVHRDLKPQNIMLHRQDDDTLLPKIVDFGIAKLLRPTGDLPMTSFGRLVGTRRYLSPEQIGEGAEGVSVEVGPATDQWA